MDNDNWLFRILSRHPWLPFGLLLGLMAILFLFGDRVPHPTFPKATQDEFARQGQEYQRLLNEWNQRYANLGGVGVAISDAQAMIERFRASQGQTAPPLPPEVQQESTPVVAAGQEPPQAQDGKVISYPPETYANSAAFIDARMSGFEKLHEGWGWNEGLGYQCVAGTKYFIMSALGIDLARGDGGYMLFAPSVPNPGYPGPALQDFKRRWNWENADPNTRGDAPPNSVMPPKGVANIDGRKIEYHTELIDNVDALQRGDIVFFDIHVGEFAAYTESGGLLLFDQNGTANLDPFTHHAFPKSNFRGAIRVVYHL